MLLEGTPFHLVTDDFAALMDTLRNQRTLAGAVRVEGFGYWGGQDVSVEFRPAEVDTGLVFVRSDLAGQPRIPACIENWVETPRRTTLRAGQSCVEMVEHIMAALTGLRIDNCEIWVDQAEMPGCDGSALHLVEAIRSAGILVSLGGGGRSRHAEPPRETSLLMLMALGPRRRGPPGCPRPPGPPGYPRRPMPGPGPGPGYPAHHGLRAWARGSDGSGLRVGGVGGLHL